MRAFLCGIWLSFFSPSFTLQTHWTAQEATANVQPLVLQRTAPPQRWTALQRQASEPTLFDSASYEDVKDGSSDEGLQEDNGWYGTKAVVDEDERGKGTAKMDGQSFDTEDLGQLVDDIADSWYSKTAASDETPADAVPKRGLPEHDLHILSGPFVRKSEDAGLPDNASGDAQRSLKEKPMRRSGQEEKDEEEKEEEEEKIRQTEVSTAALFESFAPELQKEPHFMVKDEDVSATLLESRAPRIAKGLHLRGPHLLAKWVAAPTGDWSESPSQASRMQPDFMVADFLEPRGPAKMLEVAPVADDQSRPTESFELPVQAPKKEAGVMVVKHRGGETSSGGSLVEAKSRKTSLLVEGAATAPIEQLEPRALGAQVEKVTADEGLARRGVQKADDRRLFREFQADGAATVKDDAPSVFITVASMRENFTSREAFRHRWRHGSDANSTMKFAVCLNPFREDIFTNLYNESKVFDDLMLLNCVEDANRATLVEQTLQAMKAYHDRYHKQSFFMHVEDTTFVAWHRLFDFLKRVHDQDSDIAYMGELANGLTYWEADAQREHPSFMRGGFVLGGKLVDRILDKGLALTGASVPSSHDQAVGVWVDSVRRDGVPVPFVSLQRKQADRRSDTSCSIAWRSYPFVWHDGLKDREAACLSQIDASNFEDRLVGTCFDSCSKAVVGQLSPWPELNRPP